MTIEFTPSIKFFHQSEVTTEADGTCVIWHTRQFLCFRFYWNKVV